MGDILSGVDLGISTLGEVAVKAGEAALIADYPFLGLPVIKQIWEFFLEKLEAKIVVQLQEGSAVIIIRVTDEAQRAAADAAKDALAKAQSGVDDAVHQKALDDFEKAYEDLIRERISIPLP